LVLLRAVPSAPFPYTTLFRSGAYGVGALLADLAAGPLLRLAGGHTVMVAGLISNGVLVAVMPFLEGAFLLLVATVVWGFSPATIDRKSTRLNSSHVSISYAVF